MKVIEKEFEVSQSIGDISYIVSYISKNDSIFTSIPDSLYIYKDTSKRIFVKLEVNDVRVTLSENESIFFYGSDNICELCRENSKCIKVIGEKTTSFSLWSRDSIYICSRCLLELRDFRDHIIKSIDSEDIIKNLL